MAFTDFISVFASQNHLQIPNKETFADAKAMEIIMNENEKTFTEADRFNEVSKLISDFTDTTTDNEAAESLEFMRARLEKRPDDWRANIAVAQIITRNFTRHGITRDIFDEAGGHIDSALKSMPGTLYKLRDLLNKSDVSDEQAASTLRSAVENVAEMIDRYSTLWKDYSDAEEELYRKPIREGIEKHEAELADDREKLSETDAALAGLQSEFDEAKAELDMLNSRASKLAIFKWLWIVFVAAAIAGFSFSQPILGAAAIIVGAASILPFALSRSKASKYENGEFAEAERKLRDLESERSHISSDIEFHENWIAGKREYL